MVFFDLYFELFFVFFDIFCNAENLLLMKKECLSNIRDKTLKGSNKPTLHRILCMDMRDICLSDWTLASFGLMDIRPKWREGGQIAEMA